MAFNEDARVKIPAILHLIRLGYVYIPQGEQIRREETNIFEEIFSQSILKLNPRRDVSDIKRILDEISLELDYEDLGQKFYQRLTSAAGIKLIDFQNFSNNAFHVTTELTCKNGEEEFLTKLNSFEERLVGMFAEGKDLDSEILGNLKRLKFSPFDSAQGPPPGG